MWKNNYTLEESAGRQRKGDKNKEMYREEVIFSRKLVKSGCINLLFLRGEKE